MAMQTYASTSALLAPRISPRRTTVTRLFSVSATASSPSASLSRSTPPRIAGPRARTPHAEPAHAPEDRAPARRHPTGEALPGRAVVGPAALEQGMQLARYHAHRSQTNRHRVVAILPNRYAPPCRTLVGVCSGEG